MFKRNKRAFKLGQKLRFYREQGSLTFFSVLVVTYRRDISRLYQTDLSTARQIRIFSELSWYIAAILGDSEHPIAAIQTSKMALCGHSQFRFKTI